MVIHSFDAPLTYPAVVRPGGSVGVAARAHRPIATGEVGVQVVLFLVGVVEGYGTRIRYHRLQVRHRQQEYHRVEHNDIKGSPKTTNLSLVDCFRGFQGIYYLSIMV